MKEKVKFYVCPICGNIITVIDGNINNIKCCGRPMELLEAGVTDASTEKHVPVYKTDGDSLIVRVGSVEHPMEDEHYITWIAQVTDDTVNFKRLSPGTTTETKFPYVSASIIYAYCNLHGLWKTIVE